MASIYGTALMGGVGGVNENLPPMVTELKAAALNSQINLSWKNPISEYLFGILITYNTDHIPVKPTDGTQTKVGKVEAATLTGLVNDTKHYIRLFPFNEKGQYQTLMDGSFVEATPAIGPAKVTEFKVTGSGANPVLTWKNPTTDPLYYTTVVIQKEGSAPSGLSDGTEIFRGTNETCTATGLEQSTDYYFAVFTLSSDGGTRGPVVSDVYSYDFPEEPTEYTMIEDRADSGEFIAPEDGWYQLDACGQSGDGGNAYFVRQGGTKPDLQYSGHGGNSGSIARKSKIKLNKGERLLFTIDDTGGEWFNKGNVHIPSLSIVALGMDKQPSSQSYIDNKATASGGDVNIDGELGNRGTGGGTSGFMPGGSGAKTKNDFGLTLTAGNGGDNRNGNKDNGTPGTKAFIRFYRGNTNTPSPSQASVLSLIPHNGEIEANWKNSGDPEQAGTTLVYNTSHTPKSPSDGVAIDVPLTQPVMLALNSDSEELQEESKKQSYTIKGVPNNKPVFVALFPYDKDRKYGLAKQEVEIPREHSWYDKQQELEAEVETVKAEMADYQSYYTTTQEVLK